MRRRRRFTGNRGTWIGPDRLVHDIDTYGARCGDHSFMRLPRTSGKRQLVTCLQCASMPPPDESEEDDEQGH